jgi:hypothetical protein
MNANVATANRLLAPADVLDVDENMSASMDIGGDRLLLVFAGFIAVVCRLSGLALLVISSAAFFE